ncbi:hypothetical protein [Crateriforma conspicua]|uniref:Uncharacterized protein n=1 Tax=Crateriforma conspicua TaxID=2527996 RepID=A0A5C5YCE6_9PLAN|nr:hypothetical protein [Crateriforma conspicua]TWT72598.1 hypothetical protein Pan14r_49180 [Crateriforma conspicua]
MNPFKTRQQAIAFICVGVAVVLLCVASIAIAESFMPNNLAGRRGVVIFYRTFTPMTVVWSLLASWAYFNIPPRSCSGELASDDEGDIARDSTGCEV